MLEFSNSKIGTFNAGDSIMASDPNQEGIVFATKPGEWSVYRLADETRTHELVIIHESLGEWDFSEDKIPWVLEPGEVTVGSGSYGFFNLQSFQEKEGKLYKEYKDSLALTGFGTSESGCAASVEFSDSAYNLFLSYDKNGEAIAAKVIFVEEEAFDNSDFESYREDDDIESCYPASLFIDDDYEFGNEPEDEDY